MKIKVILSAVLLMLLGSGVVWAGDRLLPPLSLVVSNSAAAIAEVQESNVQDKSTKDSKSSPWTPLWYLQRIVATLVGAFCVFLGYKLFVLGVTGRASLSIQSTTMSGQLVNAAPGLFFALFGMVIIVVAIWKT